METKLFTEENELPKGAVMAEALAEAELERWFDHRKVKEKARHNIDEDLNKDVMREKMIEGFMYGLLEYNPESGKLHQVLEFPIESEGKSQIINELVWKPRFRETELTIPMRGVKTNDQSGRMKAYMSAITGVDRIKLGALDYSDYSLAQTIVSYFLL